MASASRSHRLVVPATSEPAAVRFRVDASDVKRHTYAIELVIARPAGRQLVSLPAWAPGSYRIRDFARHLNGLVARQGKTAQPVRQIDKATWEIRANPVQELVLRYTVYALDPSVRAAWLDSERGFFNGASLLLRVHGRERERHLIDLPAPAGRAGWELATALAPLQTDARGFGRYEAADYDELIDHPCALGVLWSGRFQARGLPHRVVVTGAPASLDGERLLRDLRVLCETHLRFWHGRGRPRRREYVFLLQATAGGYGGIEHRDSSAIVCGRNDLPRMAGALPLPGNTEGYRTLLGVCSHEYFHAWNVKRMRPAAFAPCDTTRETYTELLWFFEGFTSYYDDLLLHRAGLIDEAAYLRRLTKSINQVLQAPGRHVQTVAQASFDAWTRLYQPDENTANSTISYYSKGSLIALALDLALRAEGKTTLDAVMRLLWQRHQRRPLTEADIETALAECAGRPIGRELAAWVHGTDDLPLERLLVTQGIGVAQERTPLAQALGLRVDEKDGLRLRVVLDGSPAQRAGMAAGDEWLALEVAVAAHASSAIWRVRTLDEVALFVGNASQVTAWVARDQRILRLPLALQAPGTTWRLLRQNAGVAPPGWPLTPAGPGKSIRHQLSKGSTAAPSASG